MVEIPGGHSIIWPRGYVPLNRVGVVFRVLSLKQLIQFHYLKP